eukprot:CAMPEP_0194324826 /NCGR_PEP_ID=MMETSP0171-20130528/28883_1 /TAXON_ID=218684 /ORGANISM="Corethron pennatum, Strain L29A3" /LENGTH=143 /DNA_ID=CAMNT_0039083813 /DNA_START=1042 /DNA_END=1473 /DNA_ORIENTATION=+
MDDGSGHLDLPFFQPVRFPLRCRLQQPIHAGLKRSHINVIPAFAVVVDRNFNGPGQVAPAKRAHADPGLLPHRAQVRLDEIAGENVTPGAVGLFPAHLEERIRLTENVAFHVREFYPADLEGQRPLVSGGQFIDRGVTAPDCV